MNRYKKLLGNSLIFAVGNFGSKVINFLMVPLYTYVLTKNEYGEVDLQLTTISLFVPFLTFLLSEAILRFVINNIEDKDKIRILFSSGILFSVTVPLALNLLLVIVFSIFDIFSGTRVLFSMLLFLNGVQQFLAQFIRSIGKVKIYAINGILMTFIMASTNIIFLVCLNLRVNGYLLSSITAFICSIIFLMFFCDFKQYFNLKYFDIGALLKMFKYSVPLIPNYSIWWFINGATRYFILFFVGASGNGLFAVANKIPSLISMFTDVFSQAWQMSAFEEYDSEDKSDFYSSVFKHYYQLLFILGGILIAIVKPLMGYLVSSEFYMAWDLIPLLVVAVIYQTFSGFIGTIYTASLDTKGIFTSSILTGFISIILNLVLLPIWGLKGAGVSMVFSFVVMFIVRLIGTRKIVYTVINYKKFFISNILVLGEIYILYTVADTIKSTSYSLILSFILIIINIDVILIVIRNIRKQKIVK